MGDKLEDGDKDNLESVIKELREACKSENMTEVETMMEKLNSTWQEISTKLYQQTETEEPKTESKVDEVTDVEYEEVKE